MAATTAMAAVMMKLMKVLVAELVVGSVFAAVPSQASGIDGKAIGCEIFDRSGNP